MSTIRTRPTSAEKQAVWKAFHAGRPIRVPLRWNVNPRIVIQNPELNPDGWTFEQLMFDPEISIRAQIRFMEYRAEVLSTTCDMTDALPETWDVGVCVFNTYEGSYFGAPYGQEVRFREGQCPSSEHFLSEDDVADFLARDYSRPLENAWVRRMLALRETFAACADGMTHRGRPVRVSPFAVGGSDGVATTAADLFGAEFFCLLGAEPEIAFAIMEKILEAQILRTKVLCTHAGFEPMQQTVCYADDSVQLVGSAMYDTWVLPLHQRWYEAFDPDGRKARAMHLCGDATRHFPSLRERCGVTAFDTGFPVDFAWLRKALGPETAISGGVPVSVIMSGSPQACHEAARDILQSGIMEGGRFILQEANNLPPCAPLENLAAIYDACLAYGYPQQPA